MNITDRLAETMFQPSCGRCGSQLEDRLGWRKVKLFDANNRLVVWHWNCPACLVDYYWWMDNPPENPQPDTLSSTDVPKGAT